MRVLQLIAVAALLFLLVGEVGAQETTPSHGDIRFGERPASTPADNPTKGRIEIYNSNGDDGNGQWQWVCNDSFGLQEAKTACTQLQLSSGGAEVFTPANWTDTNDLSTPGFLDELNCDSSHTRLIDCDHAGEGVHDCSISESVGVICQDAEDSPARGDLRIAGGTSSRGRLEVFLDAQWGTVCDDEFDNREAQVACRQMGFSNGTDDTTGIYTHWSPAETQVPVHLDDLLCTGSESKLIDCRLRCDNDNPHNNNSHANLAACPDGLDNPNCLHNEDAGVNCTE